MQRAGLALLLISVAASAARVLVGCGGSDAAKVAGGDGGGDVTTGPDGAGGDDGSGGGGDAAGGGDASDGGGSACEAPTDPTRASLCVSLTPEAIAFLNDPAFDGRGLLGVQVFSNAHPDDDGGDASLAGPVILPALDGGAVDGGIALLDLRQPIPQVRFDGLPATTVYVRAVFIDDPSTIHGGIQAGWWLGGYELKHGIGQAALRPVPLAAGQARGLSLDLVALRKLTVTVSRDPNVQPAGNGQGPVSAVAVNTSTLSDAGTYLFGAATNPCGKVDGANTATAVGFVFGKGPYYTVAVLDDFGVDASFPPGGMYSLAIDGGTVFVPPADQLSYAANAYQVTQSVALTLGTPWDGGPDPVTCP